MEQIQLKQFDVIETVIEENIIRQNGIKDLVPVIIINIDSENLPWNYKEWEITNKNINPLFLLFNFKNKNSNNDYEIIISGRYFTEEFSKNISKYKNIIVSISSSEHDLLMFSI